MASALTIDTGSQLLQLLSSVLPLDIGSSTTIQGPTP